MTEAAHPAVAESAAPVPEEQQAPQPKPPTDDERKRILAKHEAKLSELTSVIGPDRAKIVADRIVGHEFAHTIDGSGRRLRLNPKVTGMKSWAIVSDDEGTAVSVSLVVAPDPEAFDEGEEVERGVHLQIPI